MVHLTQQEKKTFLFVSIVFALGAGVMVFKKSTGRNVCLLDIYTLPGSLTVDLNKADREALVALPGIGETLADEIILERRRRDGFKNVEELKTIRGITDAKFALFKDKVSISR
jgi:hypothetical protein